MKHGRAWAFVATILIVFMGCSEKSNEEETLTTPLTKSSLWEQIKSSAQPTVLLSSEFNSPTRLANVSTLAWEDGLYVSDDGLELFAFYVPVSLFKFQAYVGSYSYVAPNVCAPISTYIRGSILQGSDFELEEPFNLPDSICTHGNGIVNSEIAYASRASRDENFSHWSWHAISTNYYYDGGFSAAKNADGTYNLLFSRSTDSNQNDIYWVENAQSLHAFNLSPTPLPTPINTPLQEDNPHLERLSATELVLLFDNHYETGGSGDTHISYAISTDNGASWSAPAVIASGTINDDSEVLSAHLHQDSAKNWWLYFTSNRDGKVEIWRVQHADNNLMAAFDNFNSATMQKVIAVGSVTSNIGTIEGVGEPTLSDNGDLYFVVVYCKNQADQTAFDGCDSDPWVATKK